MFECFQIREILIQKPDQKYKTVGKGEGKRQIFLPKYDAPVLEAIDPKHKKLVAQVGLDYTIRFEGKFTIPNDHPHHDEIVVSLAMGRVSDDFDMDDLPSLLKMHNHLASHLTTTYDVDATKVSKALTAHLTVASADGALGLKAPSQDSLDTITGYMTQFAAGLVASQKQSQEIRENHKQLQENQLKLQGTVAKQGGDIEDLKAGQEFLKTGVAGNTSKIQQHDKELKEIRKISESAKKELDLLRQNAYKDAVQKIGGRTLFGADSDDDEAKKTSAAQKLDDIATPQVKYLLERFTLLLGPNAPALTEEHEKEIFKPWKDHNKVYNPNDLSRPDIRGVLQGTFFEVENPIDLVSIKSIQALIKELNTREGAVAISEGTTAPTFLTSADTSLIEKSPFLTAQILPAAFGVCQEYMVTINEDLNVTLSFVTAGDAAQSLSAVLQLACKTKGKSTQIEIEGGFSNMNINGREKIDFSFPDMQNANRISFLELNKMKLVGHVESIPLYVSTLKLTDAMVPPDSATSLLDAIHASCDSTEFTLELYGHDVTIPDDTLRELLGVVSNHQTKFVLSLMDGAWKALPEDVTKAYIDQILAAMESRSQLKLSVDADDVMNDLLKPLTELLGPNHAKSLQTIAEDGGNSLPFRVEFFDSTNKKIKAWAAAAINNIGQRPTGEAGSSSEAGTDKIEAGVQRQKVREF
jgi:hypothetical protein